jgi:hypothetical protein
MQLSKPPKPKATRKRLKKEMLSDDFKKRKIFHLTSLPVVLSLIHVRRVRHCAPDDGRVKYWGTSCELRRTALSSLQTVETLVTGNTLEAIKRSRPSVALVDIVVMEPARLSLFTIDMKLGYFTRKPEICLRLLWFQNFVCGTFLLCITTLLQ